MTDFKDEVISTSNLRKRKYDLQDAFSDIDDGLIFGLSDEIDKTVSHLRYGDIDNAPDLIRTSTLLLSQIKDNFFKGDSITSLTGDFQPILDRALQKLSVVETHLIEIESLMSKYSIPDESKLGITTAVSREHVLSSPKSSSANVFYGSVLSRADYHLRARSSQSQTYHSNGKTFEPQQGYHGARHSRSNGRTHRKLGGDDSTCVGVNAEERKNERCFRLASCARNYNLYDMFVYFFGDDINFDAGLIDKTEKISAHDEFELKKKVRIVVANTTCFKSTHVHSRPRSLKGTMLVNSCNLFTV